MSNPAENQIGDWLKKLERESWQLELLVSAFTIFLLIGANSAYDEFLYSLPFKYNTSGAALSIASIFLLIIRSSILALTIALIIHLMLRGFWIGTIGLRSVQSSIDFNELRYNEFFTEKLKKKVISLDRMVVMLDEVCSVIFAFSFLIISVLIAFGMYLVVIGVIGFVFGALLAAISGVMSTVLLVVFILIVLAYFIMGLIYMIDYFTLGFFKKIRWFARFYYVFYRFFNIITLSKLSRSIYYYMISKFSKKRIRIVYTIIGAVALFSYLFEYDQNQFFPAEPEYLEITSNAYDDQRTDDEYIRQVSIQSNFIDRPFFPLFLRYNPVDNSRIQSNCPDFTPLKKDGLNAKMEVFREQGNFQIRGRDYSKEDFQQLLECVCSIYEVRVNDSVYTDLQYRFYTHPSKNQNGLLTIIPTEAFQIGENVLEIKKVALDSVGTKSRSDYATVPFWFNPN